MIVTHFEKKDKRGMMVVEQQLKYIYLYIEEKNRAEIIKKTMSLFYEEEVEILFQNEKTINIENLDLLHGKEALYITDISGVAKVLAENGYYVIAYIHEENVDADFSKIRYVVEGIEEVDIEYYRKAFKRFAGQPWQILETQRCIIRETTVEDVDTFYDIYSEPSITLYMEDLFENKDAEIRYTKDYIEKVYGFYGFGMWTVLLRETGEVIGRAGLSMREGFDDPELGFVIGVPWQGQGVAYEVCRSILNYGKGELEFSRIQALVEAENEISLRLCRKLGFKQGGNVSIGEKEYKGLYINL